MQTLSIPKELAAVGIGGLLALWQDIEVHIYVQVAKLTPDNIYVYQQIYDAWCAENNEWKALYENNSDTGNFWAICTEHGTTMLVQGSELYVHRALLEPLRKSGVAMDWDKEDLDLVLYCIEDMGDRLICGDTKVVHAGTDAVDLVQKEPEKGAFNPSLPPTIPVILPPLTQLQVFAAEEMGAMELKVEYPMEDGETKEVNVMSGNHKKSVSELLIELSNCGFNPKRQAYEGFYGYSAFIKSLEVEGYLVYLSSKLGHTITEKGLSEGFLLFGKDGENQYIRTTAATLHIFQQVWEETGLMTQDGITYKMVASEVLKRIEVGKNERVAGSEVKCTISFQEKSLRPLSSILATLSKRGLDTYAKGITAYNQALHAAGYHIDNGRNGHETTALGLSVGIQLQMAAKGGLFWSNAESRAIPILQQVWEEAGLMVWEGKLYKMVAKS